MHSRIIGLRELNQTKEDFELIASDYLDYESLLRYDIDYCDEISVDDAVMILTRRYNNVKFNSITNQITITLDSTIKEINKTIESINKFMSENKPVNNFVNHIWDIQNLVQPEHPKVLCSYCGLVDFLDFTISIYRRMNLDKITEITFIVEKCYDYHF